MKWHRVEVEEDVKIADGDGQRLVWETESQLTLSCSF